MQVIVLADGDVGPRRALDAAWPGWLADEPRVIAADGGARHATALGLSIDRWVGDGDSLGEAGIADLIAAGIPVERARIDKDESDTELALLAGLRLRPASLVILGALGGRRIDHALANVGLLALLENEPIEASLLAHDVRVRLLTAPVRGEVPVRLALRGAIGDLVSLLPVGRDASGVTTTGLAYPLRDEPLALGRTRGLSNVRVDGDATVELQDGRLLVVETPATLSV
jgi:thiamine pyrophosphokinase